MYTPRKDNGRADALSRRTNIAGTKKITKLTILKIQEDKSLRPAKTISNLIIKTGINVLEELQEQLIQQHHNNPVHSHPGITRTIELLQQNY
jgi:hypothetical protein